MSHYLNSPDPLTSFFETMGLEAQVYANDNYLGQWSIDTSGHRQIPFHGVVTGAAEVWSHNQYVGNLNAGDIVLFPCDHEHQIRPKSKTEPARIICGFFNVKHANHESLFEHFPTIWFYSSTQSATSVWPLLIREIDAQASGYYYFFNTLARLLFLDILREQLSQQNKEDITGLLRGLSDPKISASLALIHQHYADPLSIDQMTECCYMSKNTFSRYFGQSIGMTPHQYLMHWRLEKAKALLLSQSLTLLQVSEQVGYQSDAAFRKAFKQHFGYNAYDLIKQHRPS